MLKLFLLHQQHHRVQKTSLNGFSGCRTTQNQRERERDNVWERKSWIRRRERSENV